MATGKARGVVRSLVAVLAASLVSAVALPGVATAAGPSVSLPKTGSVAVTQQARQPRAEDAASRNALSRDQAPRTGGVGSDTPSATSLSPSATWDVSGHLGDFTWSYPLRVPPAAGGLVPSMGLSYRSSAVDGHTSVTNNQPSWIGDGWDLWPGFVERTYGGCADDDGGGTVAPKTGDLCWRSDNATASYSGSGGMLICCDSGGKWRTKSDDGARIERLSGAANGDKGSKAEDTGEHWKITTVDGTQYWFGSEAGTGSTWTVPVFGDDAGEPCNQPGSFDTSHCVQAYRWNLDKVIDRNGNVIRYFYDTESNKYGMNMKDTGVSYVRGGTLNHIDYGLHETVGGRASGKVEFTTGDRCVPHSVCTTAPDRLANWPDVPWDEKCDTATCTKHAPSFWSTKRLASITTMVWRGASYEPVDRWTLDQQYPDPGTGEKAALWLKGIIHTGLAGDSPDLDLPAVTFEGTQMPNRVYTVGDGYSPLVRYRMTGVISESGGVISVNYEPVDCRSDAKPANEWTNEMRCFPVTWAPDGHEPRTDYFHKYVVAKIIQSDWLSTSTQQETSYEYLDGAAWHWDMSEFAKEDKKTWNEFRGFKRVRIRTGSLTDPGGSPITMSEQRFYRGMAGDRRDKNDKVGIRPAEVFDSLGSATSARTDSDWLQGFGFETTVYEGSASSPPDPPVVSRTVTYPDVRGPTATRGEFKAHLVGSGTQRGFTALKSGGWRETKTITTYTDRGLPDVVNDLGDMATVADDQCIRTFYNTNTDSWLLTLPSRVETVAVNCDTTARFPDHAISFTRFSYDGAAENAAPVKGNPIKTEIAKDHPASGPVYVTTATARYDAHGRATETTDATGIVSRLSFTPEAGGPVTAITVNTAVSPQIPTLPGGLVTRSIMDPAWGVPTKVIDPNGRVTETTYDPLGRQSQVWLPDRPKEDDPTQGSVRFSYLIRKTAPSVVTSTMIGPNGIPVSSNTLYDGLLRPRQVQTPAVGMKEEPDKPAVPVDEGRLIVDTRYDSHGRPYKTTQPYFNSAAVDTNLWVASDTEVPGLTRTKFDGAGRASESVYQAGALDKWKAKTSYDGDRVNVTPPAGGTATTAISDARGQTTELRQYVGPTPDGAYDSTRYKYTPAGQLAEVTGPDGKLWRFRYDLLGRKITTEDPDAGTSTFAYNDSGQLTSTKDARGFILAYAYDALGRKTELRQDSLNGRRLAQWTYDTATAGKGLAASSIRFLGELGEHKYTTTVNSYTARNLPLQASVTIPAVEGLLAGTYTSDFGYGADGSLTGETYPAVPAAEGVTAQTVNYRMDNWGRPTFTETGGGVKLVASTFYTRYGEVERLEHGVLGKRAWQSFYYDTNTRRLNRSIVDAEVPKPMQADTRYTYNPAGYITSIADLTLDQPVADIQCFRQDYLQRLTEAWTPARDTWSEEEGCTAEPSVGGLRGPAPYWQSYRYDKGGNRLEETQRTPTATAARTYTYPPAAPGQPLPAQPSTLRSVTGPGGTETYDYNTVGQTISRVKAGVNETFNWDREGHLESVTGNGKTTSFVYTAEGSRLLRKDPTGTTLYLGNQEIRLAAVGGKPTVTRYYTHGGAVVAMQQGTTLTWLGADHQSTAQVAINTATLAVTRRRQLPFGAPRGAAPSWPGEHGFVGGTLDASTGLTHLGAREYDPTIGRFISVDPIMNPANPQQMHPYAYSNNSPINFSDASGLYFIGGEDDQGNQYGISYMGGQTTVIGSPAAVKGSGTNRGSKCGSRGNCGRGDAARNLPAAKGKPPTKNEIAYFRTLGYKGSEDYTMGDALGWAVERPEGFTYYCQLVAQISPDECKTMLPPEPTFSDLVHGILDVAGWWPGIAGGVADGANAIVYLGEGNTEDAVISLLSLFPMGDFSKGARNRCSFDGDTEVLMADGTTKPISEIKVGDEVLAADPETGEKGPRTVTAVMVHEDTVLELVTENGGQVTTTEDHPFYNATDKQWQSADQLDQGDQLTTASDRPAKVLGLRVETSRVTAAFNLTVQGIHTFYVLAGADPVLVHNMCPQKRPASSSASRISMDMGSVRGVADKYGIDISDVNITKIDKERGFFAATGSNGDVVLGRDAFLNEEQLVRTLVHEKEHVRQMRAGAPYPDHYDPNNPLEAAARIHEDLFWKNHPLNNK